MLRIYSFYLFFLVLFVFLAGVLLVPFGYLASLLIKIRLLCFNKPFTSLLFHGEESSSKLKERLSSQYIQWELSFWAILFV